MRYFFEIAYNGTHYNGWQSQPNSVGVQSVVEDALSKIFRIPIRVVGSGRTDTGVHCKQQYFHADILQQFEPHQLQQKLNSFFPHDIAINSIIQVKDNANARYDALERTYHYHITSQKDPFREGFVWYHFKSLDVETMNAAAALLLGQQDFECFSKVKTDVNNFRCDIKKARWVSDGPNLTFEITANRFLRGMVRAIVGTLIEVGSNKISVDAFHAIIKSKDRRKAGANVPPHGLFLVKVVYPGSIFIN